MPSLVLYAEDDENDAFLIQRAWKQAGVPVPLVVVEDGMAAIDYLGGKGVYADRETHPLPCLVLVDLNMPGVSGIEVVKWVRSRPETFALPVVLLTSSNQDADVHRAYAQGANGYLVKPSKLEDMVVMARGIRDYWLLLNRGSATRQASEDPTAVAVPGYLK